MSVAVLIPSKTDEYLRRCLTSLETSEPGSTAAVVVGDSGLSQAVREEWPAVRFVDVPQPFVFAHAVNQMQAAAGGCDLLVLNDDTEVMTPYWKTMCETILLHRTAGSFGVVSLRIEGSVGNEEQNAAVYADQIVETNRTVCFVAALIPRGVWTQVGPMDERFRGYGYDDDDYCTRVRQVGFRLGITGAVTVKHGAAGFPHSSTYLRTLGMWEYRRRYEYNKRAYEHKYGLPMSEPAVRRCLNLGCGAKARASTELDQWVNLDAQALPGVDVVRDIVRGLPFSDGTFDHVLCDNVLEHFESRDAIFVLNEIGRVLSVGGTAEIIVPSAQQGQGAFQDPTHKSFWVPRSILYWSDALTPMGGRFVGITADLEPYPDLERGVQIGGDANALEVFIRFLVQKRPKAA